ncbi:hypothetical protein FKM82_020649 [Ascaphus truei]
MGGTYDLTNGKCTDILWIPPVNPLPPTAAQLTLADQSVLPTGGLCSPNTVLHHALATSHPNTSPHPLSSLNSDIYPDFPELVWSLY